MFVNNCSVDFEQSVYGEHTVMFYNQMIDFFKWVNQMKPGLINISQIPPTITDLMCFGNKQADISQFVNVHMNTLKEDHKYFGENKTLKTMNNQQPVFICAIYGQTRSGKTVLMRNILTHGLLDPFPKTIFVVTPCNDMIDPVEQEAWNTNIIDGMYKPKQHEISPTTIFSNATIVFRSFNDFITPDNLNIDNEESEIVRASKDGPICIVLDDCMSNIINSKNFSQLYHTLPSKLSSKHEKCTGFYVFTLLHNLFPKAGSGNNIKDMKNQCKMHFISSKNETDQINLFVMKNSRMLSNKVNAIIGCIIQHLYDEEPYSFAVHASHLNDSSQWMIYSPQNGGILNMGSGLFKNFMNCYDYIVNYLRQKAYNKRRKLY